MSLKINNRIQQTTTTTGTADFQLIAPDANRLAFDDGVTSGEEVPYYASNATGTEWEYGRGTITSGSTDQLSRTTILASSNAGAKVSFSAGTKTVYNLIPAQMTLWPGSSDAWGFTDIASATTTNIGSVNTMGANITGTTTITSFGAHVKTLRIVKFAGALTLTHDGTSLILLTGRNRTTVAGDIGIYVSDASGDWREISFSGTDAFDWTPTIVGTSVAGTPTYTAQVGKGEKIGRQVTLRFYVQINTSKGGAAGNCLIGGLPFPVPNVANAISAGVVSSYSGISLTANYTQLAVQTRINTSFLELVQTGSGQTYANLDLATQVSVNTTIIGQIQYNV